MVGGRRTSRNSRDWSALENFRKFGEFLEKKEVERQGNNSNFHLAGVVTSDEGSLVGQY